MKTSRAFFALFALIFCIRPALPQDPVGRIEGTVVDEGTGAPVPGAIVTLSEGVWPWRGRVSVSVLPASEISWRTSRRTLRQWCSSSDW